MISVPMYLGVGTLNQICQQFVGLDTFITPHDCAPKPPSPCNSMMNANLFSCYSSGGTWRLCSWC